MTETARWSAHVGAVEVRFGAGRLAELGELARRVLGRAEEPARALLVTDPGVAAAGHARRARQALAGAGLDLHVFDGVGENPTTDQVEAGREAAAAHGAELLVAVGGGSALDCTKGINFLLTNGGRMEDYWGRGKASKPMLPSIGVPTTAGTGSEAQSFALISQAGSHRKMACGDEKARFRAVLLDPELVATVPPRVAALAGLDALSHAVESFVSRAANPVSRLLAREAWRRLEGHLESFLAQLRSPDRVGEAAGEMLLGAHLAGAAIEQSMLGAAHACANPLTARFRIEHGAAVGLMLPAVVRFNGEVAEAGYRELLEAAGRAGEGRPPEALAARLEELRAAAGLPARLAERGVERETLPALAREAAEQWTAGFNPRPVDETDLLRLYEQAH